MGNGGAKMSGLEEAPQTIPESIEGVLKEVRTKMYSALSFGSCSLTFKID